MTIIDAKVYVPAKDFAASQRFYRALGFTLSPGWGGTVDCTLGALAFRLHGSLRCGLGQQLHVRARRRRRAGLVRPRGGATGEFPTIRVKPPEIVEDERDGSKDLVTHVVDPSGVLLVLVQARSKA